MEVEPETHYYPGRNPVRYFGVHARRVWEGASKPVCSSVGPACAGCELQTRLGYHQRTYQIFTGFHRVRLPNVHRVPYVLRQ